MNVTTFLHKLQKNSRLCARLLKAFLSFISRCYQTAIIWRNSRYDRRPHLVHKLDAPVISLGNITAGGTGKTPAAVWLVRQLGNLSSRKPVLLSRGYGQDEVRLLSQLLPDVPH